MHFEVLVQVVGPTEAFVADGTLVGFVVGVRPSVARQLIGATETPGAAGPVTSERFLAGVTPKVSLQVR